MWSHTKRSRSSGTGLNARLHVSTSAGQECYQHTNTLLEVEPKKLRSTLADVMTEALIDALGDTLAEVEAETLGDTLADVTAEALLHALADTVAEVEAETLYETMSDMKAETLVEVLHDTVARD